MTFPISPGVYDREIDASVVTIQAPGAPGAFVANLNWGPVLKRKVISSEEQLKQIYSRPFLQNNYDFLLASQFLSYSDNLLLTRVSNGNNSFSSRSSGPIECVPSDISFPNNLIEGGNTYTINYRINQGPVQQMNIFLENSTGSSYFIFDIISELPFSFSSGGGGIAQYFYYAGGFSGSLSGGDGSAEFEGGLNPTSFTLLTFEDSDFNSQDFDFVQQTFGESITIHSCGLKDWPGL